MTICDKINEVGETLEENLNDRGVSCTFGTGTGESTVLDMVEMVNGTNFKGSSDVNLKIGANRPYLLTGETTDVVVKLEDGLCEPLKNKNVIVGQSIFQDGGTTSNYTNWDTVASTMQMTRQTTYTELKRKTDATSFGYITKSLSVTDGITIEFDLKQATLPSTNKNYFTFRATGGSVKLGISKSYQDLADGQWHHYKLVVNGLTVTPTIDGVQKTNLTLSDTFTSVQFDASEEAIHHFKNFVVYENINGVTDEKGEFALYNVSVTDTTIFNATYGTETASTIVYSCLLTDYGVSNKYTNIWNNMDWFTRSSDGTSVYYQNTGSSTQQRYLSDYLSINGEDVAIDFELINSTYCRVQVERKDSGSQWLQCNYHNTNGKVHIEILSTGTYFYLDDTLFASNTTQLNQSAFRLFFLTQGNSTTNFKYKDLRIYLL